MKQRRINVHTPVTELYSDEFRRGSTYTTLRPNGSGDWLLIYTVAGSGRFVTPSGTYDSVPGDAVLYAPKDYQDYSTAPSEGKWHLLWAHFTPKPHWRTWLPWPMTEKGIRLLHFGKGYARNAFRDAMFRMVRMLRRKFPVAVDFSANALEEALLWANVASSKDEWFSIDPRIRTAIDYFVEDLRRPFLLKTLAAHCGLSVSRLAHLFKQHTGMSPQQFLERHRMQRACQLLRLSSLNIAEIADETGYPDAFYFSNRFRKYAGKSPSEFRQESNRDAV